MVTKKIKLLYAISLSILLCYIIILIENYHIISETIPSHIDLTGKVDGYSNKKHLIIMTIVNTIILGLIWLLIKKPYLANYPVEITELNKENVYKKMQLFLSLLAIITTSFFSFLIFKAINYEKEFSYFLIYIIVSPLLIIFFFKKNN